MATDMNIDNLSNVKQAHENMASLWEVFNTLAGNQDEQGTGTYREMELTFKLQQAIKSLKPGLKRVLTATAALVELHTGEKPAVPGESQTKGKKKQQQKKASSKTQTPTPTDTGDLSDCDKDDETGEESDLIIDEEEDDEENEEQQSDDEQETPQSSSAMHPTVKNPQTVPMAMGPMEQIMQLQSVPPLHPYAYQPPNKARLAHQPHWFGPQMPASQPTADWWSCGKGKGIKKRPNATTTQRTQLTTKKAKKQQQEDWISK